MIVQYCATRIAEMLHNTKHRDSSVNIPLSPDQHHCSDEAKWRIGGRISHKRFYWQRHECMHDYTGIFVGTRFVEFIQYNELTCEL